MNSQGSSSSDTFIVLLVIVGAVVGIYFYLFFSYPDETEILTQHLILGLALLLTPFALIMNFFKYKRKAYKELVYYKIKENIFLISTFYTVGIMAYVYLSYTKIYLILSDYTFYLLLLPVGLSTIVYYKLFQKIDNLKIVSKKIMAIPAITNIEKMVGFKSKKKIVASSFLKDEEVTEYTLLADEESKVIEVSHNFIFTEKQPIWLLNKGNGKKELNMHFVKKEIDAYKPILLNDYATIETMEDLKPYHILLEYGLKKLRSINKAPNVNDLLKKYNNNLEFAIMDVFYTCRHKYCFDTYYGQCYVYAKKNFKYRKLLSALDSLLMNDVQFTGIEIFHLYMVERMKNVSKNN